jgi:hypothetical protein
MMQTMTSPMPEPAPATPPPTPSRQVTPGGLVATAVGLFLLNGALILYSPVWQLCVPLGWTAVVLAVLAAALAVHEHRRRGVTIAIAALMILHLILGGNMIWFRLGVDWRLRHVGGLPRVEVWAAGHVAALDQRFDEIGGEAGMAKLDQEGRRAFLFVYPPDRPDWLKPLTEYLPARVSHDQTGRPSAISFQLSGWDHGWGLSVYPAAQPDAHESRWPRRLSDRAFLWGRP